MDASTILNVDALLSKFKSIEYSALNDSFRASLKKSIAIVHNATENSLRSAKTSKGKAINITSPVHAHGNTYLPLKKQIKSEVSLDGTSARVRIYKSKSNRYQKEFGNDSFALQWFDSGTKERYKKGQKKLVATKKPGVNRWKRLKGSSTGKLAETDFFEKGWNSSINSAKRLLETEVTNKIKELFNK